MLKATRKILPIWKVIALTVIAVLFIGYILIPTGFSYKLQYTKTIPAPGQELKSAIQSALDQQGVNLNKMGFENIFDITNDMIAARMTYVYDINETDPNKVWKTGRGNCASYAAVQVCVLNYMFKAYNMGGLSAEWHSGRVYFAGMWLGDAYKGLGYHCYPVVYVGKKGRYFPDATFKDLLFRGYVVDKEEL